MFQLASNLGIVLLTLFFSLILNQIVAVILENYGGPKYPSENLESSKSRWVQEVRKNEGHVSPSPDVKINVPSWSSIVDEKGELNVKVYISIGTRFFPIPFYCFFNMHISYLCFFSYPIEKMPRTPAFGQGFACRTWQSWPRRLQQ